MARGTIYTHGYCALCDLNQQSYSYLRKCSGNQPYKYIVKYLLMFPKFVSVTYPKRLIYMADNTATNDVTGDRIATKRSTTYADNYDAIFRKDLNNQLLHDPIDGFNHTSPRKEEEHEQPSRQTTQD